MKSLLAISFVLLGCRPPPAACPTTPPPPHDDGKQTTIDDQAKRIAQLEAELATRPAALAPIVEQAPKAPIDDKAMAAASKDFLDLVAASRTTIHACYRTALKKDAVLAGRVVQLALMAKFAADGKLDQFSTSPSIGETFDACVGAIAAKWSIARLSAATTFKAQITLEPK